jgi:hypothetical protein
MDKVEIGQSVHNGPLHRYIQLLRCLLERLFFAQIGIYVSVARWQTKIPIWVNLGMSCI